MKLYTRNTQEVEIHSNVPEVNAVVLTALAEVSDDKYVQAAVGNTTQTLHREPYT